MKIFVLALLAASSAQADLIQYSHKGFGGTGTLNNLALTDVNFEIISIAETADVQSYSGGYFIMNLSSKIIIDGVGEVLFTDSKRTYVNQSSGQVGFSKGDDGLDLYNGPQTDVLKTWDLVTAIGPLEGPCWLTQWNNFPIATDHGVLYFRELEVRGIFEAKIVPAPGAAALGFTMLGLAARRRRA